MLLVPVLCYLITAISFVFPPASFLFEDFKSTHCTFVPKLDSAPAWVKATSAEVCKAPSQKALFQEASVSVVCMLNEQPKALFVLKGSAKDLFVINKATFPVLPVCPVFAPTCKPILVMALLSNPFPSCPASSVSPLPPSSELIPTVKGWTLNLLVVSKELFFEDGYLNRSLAILVLSLYLTLVRPRIRRHKTRCRYPIRQ